jgi:hypothetical protein
MLDSNPKDPKNGNWSCGRGVGLSKRDWENDSQEVLQVGRASLCSSRGWDYGLKLGF